MKKLFSKVWNKEEGFTLIELIIVIAILAIIAAIAIPNVLSAVDNSRKTTDISNGKMIADAAATVRAQNDDFSGYNGTSNLAVDTADSFTEAVSAQLNSVPTPKYKGTAISEDAFLVSVDATGTIQVFVGAATGVDVTTGTALMVYPTADAAYDSN